MHIVRLGESADQRRQPDENSENDARQGALLCLWTKKSFEF
jgi:hypothetical protein